MARKRVLDLTRPGEVPKALLDPSSPVWHDNDATAALRAALRLPATEPHSLAPRAPCTENYRRTAHAWAIAHGYVNKWGSPDLERLAQLGITELRTRSVCPHV